jgi:6-phosphogluconate dehydrogenase (decarboxylating)
LLLTGEIVKLSFWEAGYGFPKTFYHNQGGNKMDEYGMMELIQEGMDLIKEEDRLDGEEPRIKRILTFEGAGLLTNNKGLIIRTNDGSEFQITIIKSK